MISLNLSTIQEHRVESARISAAMNEFMCRGGQVQQLDSFSGNPIPPVRSDRIDPETVLKRKPARITREQRRIFRQLAEAL